MDEITVDETSEDQDNDDASSVEDIVEIDREED